MRRGSTLWVIALATAAGLLACTASAAQAESLMSEGNVSMQIVGNQEGTNVMSIEGTQLSCSTAHFSTAGEVASPTASLEMHPEYSGCVSFGFLNSKIATEGCNFVFGVGEAKAGTLAVSCTAGHVITITGGTCQVTIGSQEGVAGVSYSNVSGDVRVSLNAHLAATKARDGIGCQLNGTGAATLTYAGDILLEASHEGAPVSITVE